MNKKVKIMQQEILKPHWAMLSNDDPDSAIQMNS